jgi:energy-coupling factor transporter ATP-binding protein EcfA2
VLRIIEACAENLAEKGIQFETIDGEELSVRLKDLYEIVDDFFGREWVTRFCGVTAAQTLSNRLRPGEITRLKASLHECYASHFAAVDPGVIGQMPIPGGAKISIGLADRYVPPDLWLEQEIAALPAEQVFQPTVEPPTGAEATSAAATTRDEPKLRQERRRAPLEVWLGDTDREVVLGPPGSGKSTLLRFLALDMLSPNPAFLALRRLRPDFIPVWVSFPFWTRLIATDKDRSSLIETIETWFRRQDEPQIVELVRKALDDKRLMLLVDGVDEWENETAANTALTLLQAFAARHSLPVFVSSRPHGLRLMGGLAGSWRVSEIAPLTVEQQIDLASAWFAHLGTAPTGERHDARARQQATDFVAELQSNGAIAQLGATPLLLAGLIALRLARLQLPRNRFLAYAELAKLLLETHPTSRDRAALAGAPRHTLDNFTREAALAALAYGIHTGQEQASPDSIEIDRAADVISQCLVQRVGMTSSDARQNARALVTLGEEDIGILVQKSPREVGFFHRIFQEFLAAQHLGGLPFDEQVEIVRTHATDPRWNEVILCLLYQLQRPSEVDRVIEVIEKLEGPPNALMMRDFFLAEIAFGEFKRSPGLAKRLGEETFVQIETGRWPSPIRRGLVSHAIDGLSSTVLGNRVTQKVSEWFPRWHSYGLRDVFEAMTRWPEEELTAKVLWRGLHDEFYDAARMAARTVAARYSAQTEHSSRLLKLVSAPPGFGAAAAGIEALWRGWPNLPELNDVLERGRHSPSELIAIAAIRGRVAQKSHTDDDLTLLMEIGKANDYRLRGLVAESLLAGWSGDRRLWDYAANSTPEARKRTFPRRGPDFWLLINGFPGDPDLAAMIVDDLSQPDPLASWNMMNWLRLPGTSRIIPLSSRRSKNGLRQALATTMLTGLRKSQKSPPRP